MSEYNPFNWYWKADDGRLFSSSSQSMVSSGDAEYTAWVATGRSATSWPRDIQGNQTNAALQEVLSPYGLFTDLVAYARHARWRREVGGMIFSGVPVATDDRSQTKIMGARLAAVANSEFSARWDGSDGEVYPLGSAELIALSDALQAHVSGCFDTFAIVKDAIDAGTMTSRAEVDAAFAG